MEVMRPTGWGRSSGSAVTLTVAALALLSGCGSTADAGDLGEPSSITSAPPASPADPSNPSGGDPSGNGQGAAGVPGPKDDRPTSTLPDSGPEFPITLRRTGGAAGFNDVVVLRSDGRLEVTTRTLHGRTCLLTAAQRTEAVALFSILPTAGQASPSDTPSSGDGLPSDDAPTDPIVVTATDVNHRVLDLSSPSDARAAALAGDLVADATLTAPVRTACQTPTGAPSGALSN